MLQIYFYNPKDESKNQAVNSKSFKAQLVVFCLGLGTRFAELMVFFNPVVFHLSVQDRIALWQLSILGYFFKVVSFDYIIFENCHVAGLVLA